MIKMRSWLTHQAPRKPLGRLLLMVLGVNHTFFGHEEVQPLQGVWGQFDFIVCFLELWFLFAHQQV